MRHIPFVPHRHSMIAIDHSDSCAGHLSPFFRLSFPVAVRQSAVMNICALRMHARRSATVRCFSLYVDDASRMTKGSLNVAICSCSERKAMSRRARRGISACLLVHVLLLAVPTHSAASRPIAPGLSSRAHHARGVARTKACIRCARPI